MQGAINKTFPFNFLDGLILKLFNSQTAQSAGCSIHRLLNYNLFNSHTIHYKYIRYFQAILSRYN